MLRSTTTTTKDRRFKKGIDGEDQRQKRREQQVELRKGTQIEQMAKRRHAVVAGRNQDGKQPDDSLPQDINVKELLPRLVADVRSNDPAKMYEAVKDLRRLLSREKNPPIDEVVATGVVPQMVELLKSADNKIQFEAAWALTNIASGSSHHTRAVVESGGLPGFIALVSSADMDVREQAVWALGNIAGDSAHLRDLVLNAGAMRPLLSQVKPTANMTMLRNIAWTLSNLCRGKPQPKFSLISPCLPAVVALIRKCADEDVLTDSIWAISYISDDHNAENDRIQAVVASDVVPMLVSLLKHPNNSIKTPALRALGNIVTGDDNQTDVVIRCGVVDHLAELLKSDRRSLVKEACWTLSNITAGNDTQIQSVLSRPNLVATLVELAKNAEFEIKKEAAWALSNATSGGRPDQLHFLAAQNALVPLCDLLECADTKVVLICLEALSNFLGLGKAQGGDNNVFAEAVERVGGLEKLDALQRHKHQSVYNKAVEIIEEFFDVEEEEEPVMEAGATEFSFGSSAATAQFAF